MRLLLAAALVAAAVLPATAAAAPRHAPKPSTATAVTAEHSVDGRQITVTLRRHARSVIVCDLAPVVCAVVQRRGRHWEAVLPDGPIAQGLAGSGIDIQQPTTIAGGGASFH